MRRNQGRAKARVGDFGRALAAAVTLVALVGGIPLLLAGTIGNPLDEWPALRAGDITDGVVIDTLAAVAWIGWAQFTLAVLAELAAAARRAPMPTIPGVLPAQRDLARSLVTAALLITPTAGGVAVPSVAAFTATPATLVASAPAASALPAEGLPTESVAAVTTDDPPQAPGTGMARHGEQDAGRPLRSSASPGETTAHVVERDGPGTFWELAETYLGSGARWPELWAVNEGRRQDDGAVMTNPGLLKNGWTILIPTDLITTDRSVREHDPSRSAAPKSDAGRGIAEGASGGQVVVQDGDNLTKIAARHGVDGWEPLWRHNRDRAQPAGDRLSDPDHIEPGWRIDLPQPAARDSKAGGPRRVEPERQPDTETAPSERGNGRAPEPRVPAQAPVPAPSSTLAPPPQTPMPPTASASPPSSESPAPSPALVEPGVGVGAGAAVLSGLVLLALTSRRRRQLRHRRPGRAIPATPPDLIQTEKALRRQAVGPFTDVAWLDLALRSLPPLLTAQPDGRLPDVIAARLGQEDLELILAESHPAPPPPWRAVNEDGSRWALHRDADLGDVESRRAFHFAPYPALTSIGTSSDGSHWLLDLEHASVVRLTGDAERCLDLARFLAAELAHNTWSEQLTVTVAGFGGEMAAMHPDRLQHTDLDYLDGFNAAIAEITRHLEAATETMTQAGVTVLEGRLRDIAGDSWLPHILLAATNTAAEADDRAHGQADGHEGSLKALADLVGLVDHVRRSRAACGRTAAAVVLIEPAHDSTTPASGPDQGTSLGLRAAHEATLDADVDDAGVLRIPALGLELTAPQLPVDEAAPLAQLLAAASDLRDRPMPPARGEQPWDRHADAAGHLLPHVTVRTTTHSTTASDTQPSTIPAHLTYPADLAASPVLGSGSADPSTQVVAQAAAVKPTSVLPGPVAGYAQRAATTVDDVAALAPRVADDARRHIAQADPGLDQDLADWHDSDSRRVKLTLLGPLSVTAHGPLPDARPRRAWNTELVAYLAAHPRGVTAERLGSDLWPDDPDITGKSKIRQAIHVARKWLGADPRTGRAYLPTAMSNGTGGPAIYRLDAVLVDADLFRRLRTRGTAAGPDGIADLHAALDLVTGPPLDQRRPGGFAWLVDTPIDHELTAMIVDVAHLVATHHLAAGEPAQARAAADVALRAGSTDDIPLLDLVAACDAEGRRAEADTYIQRILTNHDAEVEEDLPPRTAEILHRRWLDPASSPR